MINCCFKRLEREKSNTYKVFLREEIFKNRASFPIASKVFLITQSDLITLTADFQSNHFLKVKITKILSTVWFFNKNKLEKFV